MFNNRPSINIGDIEVVLIRTNDWAEWRSIVTTAKREGYDAIILGLYHRLKDAVGRSIASDEVLQWTSANPPVPPFGFWANNIAFDRAVGGLVLAPEPQGKIAAQMVNQILDGSDVGSIQPTIADQGSFMFSRTGLKKWEITLPDSISKEAEFVQ